MIHSEQTLERYEKRVYALICLCMFAMLLPFPASAQTAGMAADFTGTSENAFQANLTLGWSFRVHEPIRVESLAFFDHFTSDEDGLQQDHLIRIWTDELFPHQLAATLITNDSEAIASTAENGRWLTNQIEPIVLFPGDYVIGADDPSCGGPDCDRYRFVVEQSTIPQITFLEARSASPPGPPQSPHPNLKGGYFGPTFRAVPIGILLGDVNGDGAVDLLDVAPFVDAITTGTFVPAADVNQDGSVDLLDVGPFVDLLVG